MAQPDAVRDEFQEKEKEDVYDLEAGIRRIRQPNFDGEIPGVLHVDSCSALKTSVAGTVQPCKKCVACGQDKPKAAFTLYMWSHSRTCLMCMKKLPRRKCRGFCKSLCLRDDFSAFEWRNTEDPHCRVCVQKLLDCTRCRHWFSEDSFSPPPSHYSLGRPKCQTCMSMTVQFSKKCVTCGLKKPRVAFSHNMWSHCRMANRTCMACITGRTGRPCSACKTPGFLWQAFTACEWDKPDDDRKCLWCMTKTCSQCRRAKTKKFFCRPMAVA